MKNFLTFLVLTVAIGLVGRYGENRSSEVYHEKEAARIQKAILQLDHELQHYLNQLSDSTILLPDVRALWTEKGIGFVVFENRKATQWTTNAIPFPLEFDARQKPRDGIVRLRNNWFLCRLTEQDDVLLAAYAFLRSDFEFENRYVRNKWSPLIGSSVEFDLTAAQHADFPIRLQNGESTYGLWVNEGAMEHVPPNWLTVAWILFVALLFTTLWFSANWISALTRPLYGDVWLILSLSTLRLLMVWLEFPSGLYATELFDPTLHATSWFIPSLGDLILHLIALLLIVLRWTERELNILNPWVRRMLGLIFPFIVLWPLNYLFHILVFNSSFSLDLNSPFSLDLYSFIGLATTFLALLICHRWWETAFGVLNASDTRPKVLVPWLMAAGLLQFLFFGPDRWTLALSATALVGTLVATRKWRSEKGGVYFYAPVLLVFSAVACMMLVHETEQNERENRLAMARKLDKTQNPITEFLFSDLAADIATDRKLKLALSSGVLNADEVLSILDEKLTYDHWNTYQHHIDIFDDNGGLMLSDRERTGPNYFELQSTYDRAGLTLSERLRYVENLSSQGGYLARIELESPRSRKRLILFISLLPEKRDAILGFTDLFVDQKYSTADELEGYSYARYQHHELQETQGNYPYRLTEKEYGQFKDEMSFFDKEGYSHLVFRPMEDRLVVISRPKETVIDQLTTFSYLFIFYLICMLVVALATGKLKTATEGRKSFRNRITLAMMSVSFISLLLIGMLTVVYVVREYNKRNREMISERSRSVLIELEHKLADRASFEQEDLGMLSALMVKLSKVFFTDINLYRLDGHLLATSRPRLFDEGLMCPAMDPVALEEMRLGERSSFIHRERVGDLDYLTAYVPFRNTDGEVIAFMSLPYFARQYGLQQQIFSLLATLTNIYVFLILISVVLALVISNRITEPLRSIRESLQHLALDRTNRAIDWKSNDEIGELVEEYNRTLDELVKSAELLARSERESAWREMAKQVAHEIKNPLTPMKLSIQMLQRSMADGAEDLNERIERTSRTLIEQIDALSTIATEFSTFAQMPRAAVEELDLADVLGNVTELYKNSEVRVELHLHGHGPALVRADREQLLRVFTNLIKNAIQAIPEGREGLIRIDLLRDGEQWCVTVADNGEGIPAELQEKIFVPNFTTKSSGMGLGLAMVKNIVESSNGTIRFESETGKGTTFYVSLPTA